MRTIKRATLAAGRAAILALALAGCMSAEERRQAELHEDAGACAGMGARYGSASYTQCMLQQQQRRDHKQLLQMERARISAETARNNAEMLNAMRERRRGD